MNWKIWAEIAIKTKIDRLMTLCDRTEHQIDAATDKRTELLNINGVGITSDATKLARSIIMKNVINSIKCHQGNRASSLSHDYHNSSG
jgi:hypothetical protein